ncbi:MAG: hypothetical protein E7346_03415 [Clostridiales bacterium]|nr:hypothetical protein [Clostridiales bacterium]
MDKKIIDLTKKLRNEKYIASYRPLPFWSWNDKLEKEELTEQVKWMKDQGFGGYFMHARGGLITEYLGEDWFDCIKACTDVGEKLGMQSWVYDENGWPSGFVGGKLLEDPENCDRYITYSIGEYDPNSTVSYLITDTEIVRTTKAGKGEYLNLFENVSISTADILNPDVVEKFLTLTHDEYKKRFGDAFSKLIKGFFTDEPQYYRAKHPYTKMIAKLFKEKYNEDIYDKLGLMFVDKNGYKEFRYRYWKGMQELFINAFGKMVYDWCDKNGVSLTGHYIEESSLNYQMLCCAGIMPFYEYEHIPGIDHLGKKNTGEIEARQVYSVAKQLGKKQVLTETFAGAGWDVSPRELKMTAESQYVRGVNLMCQHLLPYSIRGQRKRDYPAFYSWANSWVKEDFKSFNDYFTRLGYLLGESKENARVAILSPIRSSYFDYKRAGWTTKSDVDSSYKALAAKLSSLNIPFDIIDETVMAKHAKVMGNKLIIGACIYDFIIFSKVFTLDKTSYDLFEQYYNAGGKMLFCDDLPTHIEGKEHVYTFKSNTDFDEIIKAQDYTISDPNTQIKSTIREYNGLKFIYAVNLSNEPTTVIFSGDFKSFIRLDLENLTTESISNTVRFDGGQSYILFLSDDRVCVEEEKSNCILTLNGPKKITNCSDNYLTLDTLQFSLDGVNYSKKLRYMGVFNELLKLRYNGEVFLKYTFNVEKLPNKINFLAEDMHNIWCKINGNLIDLNCASKFDKKILKGDITKYVVLGENEVIIKINFYESDDVYFVLFGGSAVTEGLKNKLAYDTTIESCYLEGDFGVYSKSGIVKDLCQSDFYRGKDFYISERKTCVDNMIKDGYPFFVGNVEFSDEFTWDKEFCILDLKGNYAISEIYVNDAKVDKSYFSNKADISKYVVKGKNTIKIKIWSGGRNLFGPHHYQIEPPGVGPNTYELVGTWVDGVSSDETLDYSFKKFGLD